MQMKMFAQFCFFQADLRFCIGSVLMVKATISVKGLSWFHLTVKARSQ